MKKKFIPENMIPALCGITSIVVFLIFWFIGTNGSTLGKMIPRPDVVITSLFRDIFNPIGQYTLLIHIWYSMYRVLVGYIFGSIVGIVLGLAMGWNKAVEAVFSPLFRIIRPIPPIAWIPISIIWFGLGESAKIFLIFLASFSNVTLNAWTGAKNVDPKLIGASKMLGARENQIFFTIVLPASIPQIFAGLQVAMSSCWGTILAAEMVRSSEGLGWIIVAGGNNNDMKQILVGIVTIGIVGFILAVIMRKSEDVLCRWNKSGT